MGLYGDRLIDEPGPDVSKIRSGEQMKSVEVLRDKEAVLDDLEVASGSEDGKERRPALISELVKSMEPTIKPMLERIKKGTKNIDDPENLFLWATLLEDQMEKNIQKGKEENRKIEPWRIGVWKEKVEGLKRQAEDLGAPTGFDLNKENETLERYGFKTMSISANDRKLFEEATGKKLTKEETATNPRSIEEDMGIAA